MMKKEKIAGVITVYLSLVFLLLMALITTVLEAARFQAAKVCVEMAADAAVASVFADYYLPLYENYHVFGLDTGYGSAEEGSAIMEQKVSDYMTYSLQNEEKDSDSAKDMFRVRIDAVTITEKASLMRDQGAFFRAEAIDYMKYRGITAVAEQVLSSLSIFKKADDTKNLLQVKAATEEKLEEIDACILQLFEVIDGIKTNEKGIKMTWKNDIAIASDFVKKIYIGVPTAELVGIEQNELFEALKAHYTDPAQMVEAWAAFEDSRLQHLSSAKEWAALAAEEANKDTVNQNILEKYRANEEYEKKLGREDDREARKQIEQLQRLNGSCVDAVNEALAILSAVEIKQSLAQSSVWEYKDKLLSAADWLDESLFSELKSSLNTMEEYVGQSIQGVQSIYDFETMKATLLMNRATLENINKLLCQIELPEESDDIKLITDSLLSMYSSYSMEGLRFDYSEVQLDATNSSPLDGFTSLIESGIGSLLIPESDSLSDDSMLTGILPSTSLTESVPEESMDIPQDAAVNIFGMFDNGLNLSGIGKLLTESAGYLSEKVLFMGYLMEHFSSYLSKSKEKGILQYEQEYIICGNPSDKSNLQAVTMKILMIRALFCLIHVMSDSEKGTEARAFAATVLGFTGMPVLISILKFTILFIWAFDEAMVETTAILQGKDVAILPDKSSFSVTFADIPIMGKALIQEKANARKESAGLALGYQEYLMLFLFLQEEENQNLRTLDLIQENISAWYEDSFFISNVLFGANVTVEATIPVMFLNNSFIRKKFSVEKNALIFTPYTGYAY